VIALEALRLAGATFVTAGIILLESKTTVTDGAGRAVARETRKQPAGLVLGPEGFSF
jgi:hypothetical protein